MITKKRKWTICPACDGEGTTINPAIDCHGLTREDFAEDPDFAEDYMSGVYNITCAACSGSGKVTAERIKQLHQAAADRRLRAREDGDWESFIGASDLRWGA
jgi:DnaJ-class molecular chaperone